VERIIAAAKAELRIAEETLSDHEAICLKCHQYRSGYGLLRCHQGVYFARHVERCEKQIQILAGGEDGHAQDELF
jgi:hypothetical protein